MNLACIKWYTNCKGFLSSGTKQSVRNDEMSVKRDRESNPVNPDTEGTIESVDSNLSSLYTYYHITVN